MLVKTPSEAKTWDWSLFLFEGDFRREERVEPGGVGMPTCGRVSPAGAVGFKP